MQTKHDIFTLIITLSVLVLTGILIVTNHLTGEIQTGVITGLGMIFTYWFTRGGSVIAQQQSPDVTQLVQTTLDTLAQTPAKGASTSAGNVSSGNPS